LAELQLRVLWEEIMARYPNIEVVGEPERVSSVLFRAIQVLPVRIAA
jgi:cytochrome P450